MPAIITRNVKDARPFDFAGISIAVAGPADILCKGVFDHVFKVIFFLYLCDIFVMS